jgi:hypothetical protein
MSLVETGQALPKIYRFYATEYEIAETNMEEKLKRGSLVDRGANGGMAGKDVRIFYRYGRCVNVTGIGRNTLNGLEICDCAAKVETTQ